MHETKKSEKPRKSRNKDNEKMSIVSSSQASLAVVPQGNASQSFLERYGAVCFWRCGQQSAIAWQHHVATSKPVQIRDANSGRKGNFEAKSWSPAPGKEEKAMRSFICARVGALGCARNTNAIAHTKNMLNQHLTTPCAQDSAGTEQRSATPFAVEWAFVCSDRWLQHRGAST